MYSGLLSAKCLASAVVLMVILMSMRPLPNPLMVDCVQVQVVDELYWFTCRLFLYAPAWLEDSPGWWSQPFPLLGLPLCLQESKFISLSLHPLALPFFACFLLLNLDAPF